jgi:hypothetical protein
MYILYMYYGSILNAHNTQLFKEGGLLSHICWGKNTYNDLNIIFSLCCMPDYVATCPEWVGAAEAHVLPWLLSLSWWPAGGIKGGLGLDWRAGPFFHTYRYTIITEKPRVQTIHSPEHGVLSMFSLTILGLIWCRLYSTFSLPTFSCLMFSCSTFRPSI